MQRCSEKAFTMCPDRNLCGRLEDAVFMEGSECDAYNQEVENIPMTNADRIRAVSDIEIAKLFTKAVADGCPPKMEWDCAKDEDGWDACDACWCKWLQRPAEEVPE